jgi:biotin synthase
MHEKREMILKCRNDIINGKKITNFITSQLFNINNKFLLDLSDAANHITRYFHGSKVDIEELANIKKNFCSEDCTFCSQSAFFNTKITGYELPPPEEIVDQALNAKNDGASSFCLVAAWREPSILDFKKYVQLLKRLIKKLEFQLNAVLDF